MRYVVVNERIPKGITRYCACCCVPIVDGYCREIGTRLIYFNAEHYEEAVHAANVALGAYDAPKPEKKPSQVQLLCGPVWPPSNLA